MIRRLFIPFCLSVAGCLLISGPGMAQDTANQTWTTRKAEKWVRKGDWRNGLTLHPSASVDAVAFATQYHASKATWDMVFEWLRTQPLQTIAPGKYPIDGDNAFAIVSQGPTKALADTKWESHREYIDLHYVISGKEKIGEAPLATATVTHPFDGKADNANYETNDGHYFAAEPGTFFLFFPANVHRAGIAAEGVAEDKKLVIKIRVADPGAAQSGASAQSSASPQSNASAQGTAYPKKVTLDYYFNHEWMKTKDGRWIRYHYTWEDQTNNGFSKLGDVFRNEGFLTDTLAVAPSLDNLRTASVYVIVDPDTEQENPNPNYVSPADVAVLTEWVKGGGVLVLMGNDKGNCDLEHFNLLASAFSIRFNEDCKLHVIGENRTPGLLPIPENHPIFPNARVLYLKDVSSLSVQSPAVASVSKDGDVIMATAKYGKGAVFVVGDPWIYNEYIESPKLPAEVQNMEGAKEWVHWLAEQVPSGK